MTRPRLIHQLFEDCAERTPETVALIAADEQITFSELNSRAETIAEAILASRGLPTDATLPPDTMIGLAIGRGIDATAGVLGILKAGGAWVPLDPSYPPSRLSYMLGDTGAPVVLTTRPVLDRLPFLTEGDGAVLCVDEIPLTTTVSRGPRTPGEITADGPDPLAYVIYTSGSTGKPNGVLGTHRAILSRFEWMWGTFPFAADEITCAKTALNFVDSIWEMFGGLLQAIPCVIADDATARDPLALLDMLAGRGITRLVLVPSLLAALIETAGHTGTVLADLRYITASGERLPSELARRVPELAPNAVLLNLYGSTEMAADATCCVVGPEALTRDIVSIGKPLGRMRVHVVDEEMRAVAIGEEGELCVSGPGVARGYHNKPTQTAEKFITNPFAEQGDTEHARLFRSGDLAVVSPDGDIDYIGRRDFQIKLRGFKIEPSEIELTLTTHPAVSDCAVAAIDTDRGRRLVAFYVRSQGVGDPGTLAHELREYLGERLADWMVPSYFIHLDDMPHLPNGKLDRRALRLPDDFDVRSDVVAPRDDVEEVLAAIWREALGVESVSVTDEFFEVGGDSLLAARVSIAAREAGYALTPGDVYEHPSLEALARYARTARPAQPHTPVPEGLTPLSPMQRYYFSWARPNPNKFNVGFMARLATPLDQGTLQVAVAAVIEHHPALRLRFERTGDDQFSAHHGDESGEVPIHHFQLPAGDHEEFIESEVARLNDTLDIGNGPLMAVGLFDDPAGTNHHFYFTMQHLVSDAVSLQIVLEDLRTAYSALLEGRRPALPAQTTPFHQWVDRVIEYARGPAAAAQWEYWRNQALEARPMPEDDANAVALQRDIDLLSVEVLTTDEVDTVRERLGGSFQATLIHATVAALALAAHQISGQRNLVLHKAAHGRETCIKGADVSRTVGWFTTHTPITVRLPDGSLDDTAALPRVLEHVAAQYRAVPDNGLAHSALRYFSDDPRSGELARDDQVRTLLNFVGDVWDVYDGELFSPPSLRLMDMPNAVAAENHADYHLHVYVSFKDGAFLVQLFHSRTNYQPATISEIARILGEKVRGMLLVSRPL